MRCLSIKYITCALSLLAVCICLSFKVHAGIQDDFIWAVEDNNLTDVAKLLASGASPDTTNRQGYTPLMIAARTKNTNLAQLLLEAGANLDIRNKYGESAIMLASYYGLTDMVKQLYIKGAKINHSGWNPLLYAASNGHARTLQLLLSGGAEINSTSDNGTTSLMMAVRGGHLETVELLLNNGADPDIRNESGESALHWALKRNHQKIVSLLRDKGVHE